MPTFPRRRKPGAKKLSRFGKIGRQKFDASGNPVRRRGSYLLPSAFTTGGPATNMAWL